MDDNSQNITINVSAQGTAQTATDLNGVAAAAGKMGGDLETHSGKARLALNGIARASEAMGASFGLTGRLGSTLGLGLEQLAMTATTGATAIGAIVLAATVAYKIYEHFAESTAKAREETLKAADASGAWITSALTETRYTKELTAAKLEFAKAQFTVNRRTAIAGVQEESKVVDELREKYEMAARFQREGRTAEYMTATDLAEEVKKRKEALDLEEGRLRILKAEAKMYSPGNKAAAAAGKGVKKPFQDNYNTEAEYLKSLDALWSVEDSNYKGHLDMQLAVFDSNTTAKLTALSAQGASAQRIRDEFAVTELQREKLIADEKKRIRDAELKADQETNKMRWQAAQQLTTNLTSAFQTLYIAGGKSSRQYFEMWKIAAISESTVKGIQAAVNSFEFGTKLGGPAVGSIMAAASALATGAMIASIESQQLGGGGATGTYNANPITGQPQQYQLYYEQDPNNPHSGGTGWKPGEGGNNGNTYIIHGDIYAQDSHSFEKAVVKVAAKNYRDKGKLYDAIN
jgi:hypothetical protein